MSTEPTLLPNRPDPITEGAPLPWYYTEQGEFFDVGWINEGQFVTHIQVGGPSPKSDARLIVEAPHMLQLLYTLTEFGLTDEVWIKAQSILRRLGLIITSDLRPFEVAESATTPESWQVVSDGFCPEITDPISGDTIAVCCRNGRQGADDRNILQRAHLLAAAPELMSALGLIATAKDRGFDIDYAQDCARAALHRARGKP